MRTPSSGEPTRAAATAIRLHGRSMYYVIHGESVLTRPVYFRLSRRLRLAPEVM